MTSENQSPVFNTTKPQNNKKKRKSVAGISKVLLERPSGNNSSHQNASTDEDISLELAKILAKEGQKSTESTPEFLQQAEHEPYRPPSFQNYSSDSAKALLAKYNAGKTSIGSTGSLAKEDKQSTESTPELLQQAVNEPYRPPSFQNYSSDSAKALLAKYEAGKTSIGSTGSGKTGLYDSLAPPF